jgi:hypothetical protein
MGELKRRDEELTTADLAGQTSRSRETDDRPQLVRNKVPEALEYTPASSSLRENDETDPVYENERSAIANQTGNLVTTAGTGQSMTAGAANQPTPLFSESEVGDFRSRWGNIQTGFVDEPRRAVEDADNLVASLMKKLAEGFANERSRLEKQWDRGDNVSTEDLRIALQRYRSFFDRLLKV